MTFGRSPSAKQNNGRFGSEGKDLLFKYLPPFLHKEKKRHLAFHRSPAASRAVSCFPAGKSNLPAVGIKLKGYEKIRERLVSFHI
jgi:hypothetical protein